MNRSANSSIKGYNFQFINTIKNILEEDLESVITIEGIEDLDINNASAEKLYQFKYHEQSNYTNSLVGKPIGLMFNDFIKKRRNVTYKLFMHLNEELPELDSDRLKLILNLKDAKQRIDTPEKVDNQSINDFLNCLDWVKVERYDEVESGIIGQLADYFKVDKDLALHFYLPNAFKIIHDYAIKNDVEDRKLTRTNFIEKLRERQDSIITYYLLRLTDFNKFKRKILKIFEGNNIKKSSKNIIFYISNLERNDIDGLIINLIKKFSYKGNRSDFRQITFIVEDEKTNVKKLKKSIYKSINLNNEKIIMNDGFEDYYFNYEIFNAAALQTTSKSGARTKNVNYNFKLISSETYLDNIDEIFFSSPVMFLLDDDIKHKKFSKIQTSYSFKGLKNDEILEIVGGING